VTPFLAWIAGVSDNATVMALEFAVPGPPRVWLAAVAVLVFATILAWAQAHRRWSLRVRLGSAVLRGGAAAIVVFLLLHPVLAVQEPSPSDRYVAVVFDDSASMAIDAGGTNRGDSLRKRYRAADGAFERRLEATHRLARYAAGATARRVAGIEALTFLQRRSNLASGLAYAQRDLAGTNLSAAILFSDGVSTEETDAVESAVNAIGVPVFAVGVGEDAPWNDARIAELSVTRPPFDGSPVALTAYVTHGGIERREGTLRVRFGDRVVASASIVLSGGDAPQPVRLAFEPGDTGWLTYAAELAFSDSGPIDPVPQNNTKSFLVDAREKQYRILYLGGRPTWENKFIRRALEDDKELRLSSLIRISGAERKFEFKGARTSLNNPLFEGFADDPSQAPRYDEAVFLRLGLGADELLDGYPDTAEDAFAFDLIVWGDIEADYFSTRQFDVTQEFIARRGGSLLVLGGPRALGEGGFADTPLAPLFPALLSRRTDSFDAEPFSPRATLEGFLSGVWALMPDRAANRRAWEDLPELHGLNGLAMVRAGATTLAEAETEGGTRLPLFVWQRYGEGRCAVLATGNTWPWHLQTRPEDRRHARLWRQTMRALVKDVPEREALRPSAGPSVVGAPESLAFVLRDAAFDPHSGLKVDVRVEGPGDASATVVAEESLEEPGVYHAAWTPSSAGPVRFALTATDRDGETVADFQTARLVEPDDREYANAEFDRDWLSALARSTGGEYFPLRRLDALLDRIPDRDAGAVVVDRRPLWPWPGWYALLAALLIGDWYVRRRYGVAQ